MAKTAQNTVAQNVTENAGRTQEQVDFYKPLTAGTVTFCIATAIANLSNAFSEMEQRCLADNGKAYPPSASLPDGVNDTGNVIDVNRFSYVQTQLIDTVCWKLETMLTAAQKRIADQTASIKASLRNAERGQGDLSVVERQADFLDVLEEQAALIETGMKAAFAARFTELGDEYETASMRAERKAAQDAARPALPDRLARFR